MTSGMKRKNVEITATFELVIGHSLKRNAKIRITFTQLIKVSIISGLQQACLPVFILISCFY